MTFAASATCCRNQPTQRRDRAFTLIELLVVIGIIVLVVSILIPTVIHTFRAGDRARSAADIQAISVALEAFKGDFGDYPRPEPGTFNTGFAQLGRYLIGPYGDGLDTSQNPPVGDLNDPPVFTSGGNYDVGSVVRTGSLNPPQGPTYVAVATPGTTAPNATPTATDLWQLMSVNDGVDGPGMKNNGRGKTFGPYLQPDKFKVRGLAILDRNGEPFLYFPAAPKRPNIGVSPGYLTLTPVDTSSKASAYDVTDNLIFFRHSTESDDQNATIRVAAMLGDVGKVGDTISSPPDPNGQIDPILSAPPSAPKLLTETGVNLPYILWSAGPDGVFGPITDSTNIQDLLNRINACDDVTNFR